MDRPPKGISRFPDGGTPKILHKAVTLYLYTIPSARLKPLLRYGALPYAESRWSGSIDFRVTMLAFGIRPISGWDWEIRHNHPRFKEYEEKYGGIFLHDTRSGETTRLTTEGFRPLLSPDEKHVIYLTGDSEALELWHIPLDSGIKIPINRFEGASPHSLRMFWNEIGESREVYFTTGDGWRKADLLLKEVSRVRPERAQAVEEMDRSQDRILGRGELRELTAGVTFREWGVSLKEHWPAERGARLRDIVLLEGNLDYRRAILEELGGELSPGDIQSLLDRMERRRASLEGYRRAAYELYSKETIGLLRALLEEKK